MVDEFTYRTICWQFATGYILKLFMLDCYILSLKREKKQFIFIFKQPDKSWILCYTAASTHDFTACFKAASNLISNLDYIYNTRRKLFQTWLGLFYIKKNQEHRWDIYSEGERKNEMKVSVWWSQSLSFFRSAKKIMHKSCHKIIDFVV